MTHPVEKPFLVYQLGSVRKLVSDFGLLADSYDSKADPVLAVEAAKKVLQDVSAFDLNCGCPKPFSTHAGMGAALLSNPDTLCAILKSLRDFLPEDIPLSAKIRLLPSQDDTLKLVERIIETGVSALTVHCRTRAMRREPALIDRLKDIVELVERSGRDVAVIQNGDCLGYHDVPRVKRITNAHSVMIAEAAESNPSCFSPTPLEELEKTFIPSYVLLARHLGNHWSNTKFCASQFKGRNPTLGKGARKAMKDVVAKSKDYDGMTNLVGDWKKGAAEFERLKKAISDSRGQATEAKGHELCIRHPDATRSQEEALTTLESASGGSDGPASAFTREGTVVAVA